LGTATAGPGCRRGGTFFSSAATTTTAATAAGFSPRSFAPFVISEFLFRVCQRRRGGGRPLGSFRPFHPLGALGPFRPLGTARGLCGSGGTLGGSLFFGFEIPNWRDAGGRFPHWFIGGGGHVAFGSRRGFFTGATAA